jgi:hypothetical protein
MQKPLHRRWVGDNAEAGMTLRRGALGDRID